MKILQTAYFKKWAKSERLSQKQLIQASLEIAEGVFEANLGGSVLKKRIGNSGRGKRDGARIIVAYKKSELLIFIYGYMKNARSNISVKEKVGFKKLAKIYFSLDDEEIEKLLKSNELIEVL